VTGTVRQIGLFVTSMNTPDSVLTIVGNGKILGDHADAASRLKQRLARIPTVMTDPAPARSHRPLLAGILGRKIARSARRSAGPAVQCSSSTARSTPTRTGDDARARRTCMKRLAAIALGLALGVAACSTAPPTGPDVLNVRGVWIGDWNYEPATAGSGMFTMTLTQNGADVAGAVQLTGLDRRSPTQVRGVLKGDEIHLVGMASNGVLKVKGNEMRGVLERDGQAARVIARRQTD
jgi:hypothetical protein